MWLSCVPWMLDFVAGTLSHRLSVVRFSVCMAGASKARFVHILCCEEYFCVIFLGGLLYHCELCMVFGGKANCCAGCHPCDL